MFLVPFGLFTPTGPVAVLQARVREGFAMCQARSKKQNEERGWEQGGEVGAAPIPGPRSWGTVVWGSHGPCPGTGSCPAPWRSSLATQLPWTAPQSAVPRMLTEGGKKNITTYVPFKGQNHARADRRQHEPTHQPTQLGFPKLFSPLRDMLLHCLAQNFSKTFLCLPSQQWTCANIYSSQIQRTGKEI